MSRWRGHLSVLAATLILTLVLFGRDATAMAGQWWNSSTYGHCLLILPLSAWLIWRRRLLLVQVEPAAWLPGLGVSALAASAWLIGAAAEVALIRHIALVGMVQAAVLTILGPGVFRALLFPIAYLLFMVPFGDEFVPALQQLTAGMIMPLLHLARIPAVIDGVFITTPDGWFEVAEACSGVKFLIAMVAYGALVANICFRSPIRRVAFMALCVIAPVFANAFRAFATIFAAQLTDAATATGFDHLVYGWFFFAFVLILVTLAGSLFFDRGPRDEEYPSVTASVRRADPLFATSLALGLTLVFPPLWNAFIAGANRQALPRSVSLPPVHGWSLVRNTTGHPWVPRFDGADHRLYGRYRSRSGQSIDVAIALYGWQGDGRKIAAFGQGAIDSSSNWAWSANVPSRSGAIVQRLLGPDKTAREAATYYVVGGHATGNVMAVRLRTLKARIFGGDQSAGVFIASAEGSAPPAMDAFLHALGPVELVMGRLVKTARGD